MRDVYSEPFGRPSLNARPGGHNHSGVSGDAQHKGPRKNAKLSSKCSCSSGAWPRVNARRKQPRPNSQSPWKHRGNALWLKLKEEMCFAQISFPVDVVHIAKISPLVFIQIHVLRFLFNLELNKSQDSLEGGEMPKPN